MMLSASWSLQVLRCCICHTSGIFKVYCEIDCHSILKQAYVYLRTNFGWDLTFKVSPQGYILIQCACAVLTLDCGFPHIIRDRIFSVMYERKV